jgi:Domain of unknown function (DUF5658)
LTDTSVDLSGERRYKGGDRRKRPTSPFSRYAFIGRRSAARRSGEGTNIYVDRYSGRVMAVLLLIAGLCILDALFTLLYLQRGGGEMNPLMDAAIQAGVIPFIVIKCGLTFAGITFLCLHKNFRFVRVIMASVLVLYVALMVYHYYVASII